MNRWHVDEEEISSSCVIKVFLSTEKSFYDDLDLRSKNRTLDFSINPMNQLELAHLQSFIPTHVTESI